MVVEDETTQFLDIQEGSGGCGITKTRSLLDSATAGRASVLDVVAVLSEIEYLYLFIYFVAQIIRDGERLLRTGYSILRLNVRKAVRP